MTTPHGLLTELRACGVVLAAHGDRLHVEAPKGVITPEMKAALVVHKDELLRLVSLPILDADASELAAVLLRNTVIGDCWLVADHEALAQHPEILRSGNPVIFFDEVNHLRGKTSTELKAIGLVKATFPTGRILQ